MSGEDQATLLAFRISSNAQDYYQFRLSPMSNAVPAKGQGTRPPAAVTGRRIDDDGELAIESKMTSVRVYLLQDCIPKQTMTHCFNLCRWHPTPQGSRLPEIARWDSQPLMRSRRKSEP